MRRPASSSRSSTKSTRAASTTSRSAPRDERFSGHRSTARSAERTGPVSTECEMKARHHDSEQAEHGIDLAPMLDFVMNLLIFFIITTSFVKDAGVIVTKPNADTAEYKESGNILVAVRENGEVWMDRRQVDLRDVRTLVERLHVER